MALCKCRDSEAVLPKLQGRREEDVLRKQIPCVECMERERETQGEKYGQVDGLVFIERRRKRVFLYLFLANCIDHFDSMVLEKRI